MDLKIKSELISQKYEDKKPERVSGVRKDEEMYSPDTLNSSEERKLKNKSESKKSVVSEIKTDQSSSRTSIKNKSVLILKEVDCK